LLQFWSSIDISIPHLPGLQWLLHTFPPSILPHSVLPQLQRSYSHFGCFLFLIDILKIFIKLHLQTLQYLVVD
jgi:hypothetical protein